MRTSKTVVLLGLGLVVGLSYVPAAGQGDAGQLLRQQGLDPQPFSMDALGLKINLPATSIVGAEKINTQLVISVTDSQATPTWSIRIQLMPSTLEKPTPAGQIEQLFGDFKASKQTFKVLANDPVVFGGLTGQLCYVQRSNDQGQSYITGWLVLPSGERTFLVFVIQTLPEHLAALRPLLASSFATIALRSSEELASERKVRLDAGRALVESITPQRLKTMIGLSQWYRIYAPVTLDGKPATERGYSLLEVLEGKKGALNPKRDEKTYTPDEHKPGIMIRIQGRVVMNAERGLYYDSIAHYWMAWDQSEEAWSILGTQRQGDAEQSEAETGVRTAYTPAAPPPRLTVIKSDNATNSREPYEWDVPEVYLSQPIGWLLGRLLPKDAASDQELAYYFYNFSNRVPQISQRVDVWGPADDRKGNFKLTTRLTSDSAPIISLYGADGSLIRRTHADGSITEPTTLESLRKLWKSKGLQVGKTGR
jgi:hypothetical protein